MLQGNCYLSHDCSCYSLPFDTHIPHFTYPPCLYSSRWHSPHNIIHDDIISYEVMEPPGYEYNYKYKRGGCRVIHDKQLCPCLHHTMSDGTTQRVMTTHTRTCLQPR